MRPFTCDNVDICARGQLRRIRSGRIRGIERERGEYPIPARSKRFKAFPFAPQSIDHSLRGPDEMYQCDLRLGSFDPSEMSTRQKQRSMIRRLRLAPATRIVATCLKETFAHGRDSFGCAFSPIQKQGALTSRPTRISPLKTSDQ